MKIQPNILQNYDCILEKIYIPGKVITKTLTFYDRIHVRQNYFIPTATNEPWSIVQFI